jgi:hypothetical protein
LHRPGGARDRSACGAFGCRLEAVGEDALAHGLGVLAGGKGANLEAIYPGQFENRDELMAAVRAAMIAALPEEMRPDGRGAGERVTN